MFICIYHFRKFEQLVIVRSMWLTCTIPKKKSVKSLKKYFGTIKFYTEPKLSLYGKKCILLVLQLMNASLSSILPLHTGLLIAQFCLVIKVQPFMILPPTCLPNSISCPSSGYFSLSISYLRPTLSAKQRMHVAYFLCKLAATSLLAS